MSHYQKLAMEKKKKDTRDKSFKNSVLVEIRHGGMAPLMEVKKKQKTK